MGGKRRSVGRRWSQGDWCYVTKKKNKAGALKPAHVPETLTGSARDRWLWLVKTAPEGALCATDAGTVAVLACALALHEEAAGKVAEFGPVVLSGTKADVNPWVGILNAQAAIISKASRDLGLKNWRSAPATPRAAKTTQATPAGKKKAAQDDAAATVNTPAGDWGDDLNPHAIN